MPSRPSKWGPLNLNSIFLTKTITDILGPLEGSGGYSQPPCPSEGLYGGPRAVGR